MGKLFIKYTSCNLETISFLIVAMVCCQSIYDFLSFNSVFRDRDDNSFKREHLLNEFAHFMK